jgi:phosphoribosyl-ATP pyrophosphohydrolase
MARSDVLDRLYAVVEERMRTRPEGSYVVSLLAAGPEHIAAKLREETEELIEAAREGDLDHAAKEVADLLFHAWVLMGSIELRPDQVYRVLEERFGTGGLVEKASRSLAEEG